MPMDSPGWPLGPMKFGCILMPTFFQFGTTISKKLRLEDLGLSNQSLKGLNKAACGLWTFSKIGESTINIWSSTSKSSPIIDPPKTQNTQLRLPCDEHMYPAPQHKLQKSQTTDPPFQECDVFHLPSVAIFIRLHRVHCELISAFLRTTGLSYTITNVVYSVYCPVCIPRDI